MVCFVAEQYTQSIEDFNSSLEILNGCVDDVTTDRRIAETHYHIGVACVNAQRYDDAITHFRDAITILEAKIVALNAVIKDVADGQEVTDEKVLEARKELKELDDLIPEIKLKVLVWAFVCIFTCSDSSRGSYTRLLRTYVDIRRS